MGTAICFYAERKNKTTNRWEIITPPPNLYGCGNDFNLSSNYFLFSILSNVRNGFNGHCKVNFIKDCTGFPKDTNFDLGDDYGNWMLLKEIVDFDWDQTATFQGIISAETYIKRINEGIVDSPDSWSGSVSGPGVNVIAEEDAKKIVLSMQDKELLPFNHVKIKWEVQYNTVFKYTKFKDIIDYLKTVSETEDFTDIRVICAYDC